MADAHAAAVRRVEALILGKPQQVDDAIGRGTDAAVGKAHGAAGDLTGCCRDLRAETLGVQLARHPGLAPVRLDGIEQTLRAACIGIAVAPAGADAVECGGREVAFLSEHHFRAHARDFARLAGVDEVQLVARVLGGEGLQLLPEDHVVGVWRVVDVGDIRQALLRHEAAQYRHDRRNARASTDEQRLDRVGIGQIEVALRYANRQVVAGLDVAHQVVRHAAAVDGFHSDREALVVTLWRRRDRISAGVVHTANRHADAQVLAGPMAAPVTSRFERDGAGIRGLVPHADDLGLERMRDPERVHQLQIVRGAKGEGEGVGDRSEAAQQRALRCLRLWLHGFSSMWLVVNRFMGAAIKQICACFGA